MLNSYIFVIRKQNATRNCNVLFEFSYFGFLDPPNLYPSLGHRNLLDFLLSQFCYLLSCSFYRFCCPAIYIHLHFFCRCLIKCPTAGLLCQLCREIEPTVITSFSPALTTLLKNNIDIVITSSQNFCNYNHFFFQHQIFQQGQLTSSKFYSQPPIPD